MNEQQAPKPYKTLKIYIVHGRKSSHCTNCDRKHQKVFEIDGEPYGATCAELIFGVKSCTPLWAYLLAEEYVKARTNYKKPLETHAEDFEVGFWNDLGDRLGYRYKLGGSQGVHFQTVKIDGKYLNVTQQREIADYLVGRHADLVRAKEARECKEETTRVPS